MKAIVQVLGLMAAVSAQAQSANDGEWMKGRLINRRTGEVISAKCYEMASNGQCAKFQYFYAESEDHPPRAISQIFDQANVVDVLNERSQPKEDGADILHSSNPFYLTTTNPTGFTLFPTTEYSNDHKPGNMAFSFAKDAYRRGRYISNGLYVLQVVGATPIVALNGVMGVMCTAMSAAVDMAIWPVRWTAALFNGFESRFEATGRWRRKLKRVLNENDVLMNAKGDLYLGTTKWKAILNLIWES